MAKPQDHKSRAHALLSPSGASRWINCQQSARLEEAEGGEDTSSKAADEGTLAHELGELLVIRNIHGLERKEFKRREKPLLKHELFQEEMWEHAQGYADYVNERYQLALANDPAATILIEQRVDLRAYVPEGFGSCDVIIIADGTMEDIDFKYGKGLRVDAPGNPQLRIYALGAYDAYSYIYSIDNVRMTIYQPRLDHISSEEISAADLLAYGKEVVRPAAAAAFEGEGTLAAGDHCRWCKVAARCRTYADQQLALAKKDFCDPRLLTDEELERVYMQIPQLHAWAGTVHAFMLTEALAGRAWILHKLVAGKSNRMWKDTEKVTELLKEEKYKWSKFMISKLAGIGAVEKLVGGKKYFNELMKDLVHKPEGKPTLVHVSDKREPITLDAKDEFKD